MYRADRFVTARFVFCSLRLVFKRSEYVMFIEIDGKDADFIFYNITRKTLLLARLTVIQFFFTFQVIRTTNSQYSVLPLQTSRTVSRDR